MEQLKFFESDINISRKNKHLRVILGTKLTWNEHVNVKITKATSIMQQRKGLAYCSDNRTWIFKCYLPMIKIKEDSACRLCLEEVITADRIVCSCAALVGIRLRVSHM